MDWDINFTSVKYGLAILNMKNLMKKVIYFYNRYLRPKKHVIIFGESGTGKSQFLNAILGNPAIESSRTRYTHECTLILENGRKICFYDSPGHTSLQQDRIRLTDKIRNRKIDGILNVVNFGYSESDTAQSLSIFKVPNDKEQKIREVKESYLNENRKREISQLDEWFNLIRSDTELKWIITVINKADIWYEQREEVIDYYENGKYGQKLQQLDRCCKLYYYPYCSVISPFGGSPMILSMDEREKLRMHHKLLAEFVEIIKQKKDV